MTEVKEDIRPIPGFDGYFADTNGNIWSGVVFGPHRQIEEKTLKRLNGNVCHTGRIRMEMAINGKPVKRYVNDLVYLTFIGPKPKGRCVIHKNGIRHDNRLDNLALGSFKDVDRSGDNTYDIDDAKSFHAEHVALIEYIPGGDIRPIPGYKGYFVDKVGSVYSSKVTKYLSAGKVMLKTLVQHKQPKGGYLYFKMRINGHPVKEMVHHAVLLAFVGPPTKEKWHCCHNNGVPNDNRVENLRWDTPTANKADSIRHGTAVCGERVNDAKLTEKDVRFIRTMHQKENKGGLAKKFGVTTGTINDVIKHRSWKHVV